MKILFRGLIAYNNVFVREHGGIRFIHSQMMRQLLVLVAFAGAAAANEGVVCMASPAEKVLLCSALPTTGLLAVHAEGQAPFRAETLYLLGDGSLCEVSTPWFKREVSTPWFKREVSTPWLVRCASRAQYGRLKFKARLDERSFFDKFVAAITSTEGQLLMLVAFSVTLGLLVLPATFSLGGTGSETTFVSSLLHLAGSWWFPWLAAAATAANMFTLIFTTATVALFLAALLAKPSRWWGTALLNAAGATAGSALILALVETQGDGFIAESFPTLLASEMWAKSLGWMETYGIAGMLLVSSLPLILHPVIFFGLLVEMPRIQILTIIFTGRVVKYSVMGWIAVHAPNALRFFGIKASLFELASSATVDDQKSPSRTFPLVPPKIIESPAAVPLVGAVKAPRPSDELMRSSGLSAASVDSPVGSQSPRLSKAEAKLAKKMEKMEKKKQKKMKGIEVSI